MKSSKQSTPPSSFFPFQAYAGNPDPGLPIPRTIEEFAKPVAPFMSTISRVPSSSSLYKPTPASIPRSSSVQSFRAPFLAPSSRPTSSLWSPPSYPTLPTLFSNPSSSALPKSKPPLPSTALTQPLQPQDKPWLSRTQPGTHSSYFLTLVFIILGTLGAGLISFIGYATVPLLPDKHLCLVLNDQFSDSALDESTWNYDVQLSNSDFGPSLPGELGFQMSTKSQENIYLSNSNLYIVPTLSSQDASNFTLPDCTSQSDCTSSQIPPVASARIHTKSKKSIRFGRIAIRAKIPTGDWLHPRIYLLPESDEPYGSFPASGYIDILNARGNDMSYDAQGANFVRSAVGYGPLLSVQNEIFGWVGRKRGGLFGEQFHEFVLEWDEKFIRVYVDKRTQSMLEIPIGPISSNPFSSPSSFYFSSSSRSLTRPSFWDKASFPKTVHNSTDRVSGTEIVLPNPYQNASYAAPFDQKFYLVVDLGVGGTKQGWFPDGVGGKPWLDGEGGEGAMRSFARDQGRWLSTWKDVGGRLEKAFRIDYIKMWEKC